jgi:hypothetical protein
MLAATKADTDKPRHLSDITVAIAVLAGALIVLWEIMQ